jgi:hypothetical protein
MGIGLRCCAAAFLSLLKNVKEQLVNTMVHVRGF